jgi:hypothetical protein
VVVLHLIVTLSQLDVDVPLSVARDHVRDELIVEKLCGRPGFGDGPDEHRFRVDDHWPPS